MLQTVVSGDWQTRGSRKWRLILSSGTNGIEVVNTTDPNLVTFPHTGGAPLSVKYLWQDFGDEFIYAATHFGVKADTLVALAAIEAEAYHDTPRAYHRNPQSIRYEPGYISDEQTPNKVSPGLMQTLLSTARSVARSAWGYRSSVINRQTLFVPLNSILLGAAYIQTQWAATKGDPVLIQAAYNAGGVYASAKNAWNLRTYGEGRTENFIKYFNDFRSYADDSGGVVQRDWLTLTM